MRPLPIQPLYTDDHGTVRFRKNIIVRYLLDHGGLDLNQLERALPDCPDDWEQFAQLIGDTLDGWAELSYVREDTHAIASAMALHPVLDETEARLRYLESLLGDVRAQVKQLTALLFRIHEDDLEC